MVFHGITKNQKLSSPTALIKVKTQEKNMIASKICEVEELVTKLRDKHGSKYSVECLGTFD